MKVVATQVVQQLQPLLLVQPHAILIAATVNHLQFQNGVYGSKAEFHSTNPYILLTKQNIKMLANITNTSQARIIPGLCYFNFTFLSIVLTSQNY